MSFTVSLPGGAVQLSGNPINVVATTTTTGKTNHFMLFHIISTDGANPYGPWTESVPVNSGGATLDIHALLDADFNYDFSKVFTAAAAKVYEHDQLAANFTIEIGETYIDTNGSRFETDFDDAGAVIASTTITVLKGGLSTAEYCILEENGKTFFSEYITNPHFLTRQPGDQKLPLTAWLKLWFIPNASTQYTIVVTATYADGSTMQETFIQTWSSTKLYEINTNIACWTDIPETHNETTIVKHVISIRKTSGGIGNVFVINNDTVYYETINEFYYVNNSGGVDLLHCTGEFSEDPETSGETYTRRLPVSPTSKEATKISDRKTIARRFKCNTGFMSLEQRRALLDFLSSPYVWWKTDRYIINSVTDFALLPVIIKPGTFSIDTTSEDLKAIEFEFEIAHVDKY